MILLIWSIYILIAGKLQISKTYGVRGGIARIVGAFYLLISLGLVGNVIPLPIQEPVQNILVTFGIQLVLIIIAPIIAVAIHGNDFAKDKVRS
jgi:hypothetical protein